MTEQNYLVTNKIRKGMQNTFNIALVLITIGSLLLFAVYYQQSVRMSAVSVFYSNLWYNLEEVIRVKKEDFMLTQAQMIQASRFVVDVIERRNFNPQTLLSDEGSLQRFRENTIHLGKYVREWEQGGLPKT